MSRSFLKGAAVGFVCAVLGGAAVAFAGSGVNGVFNLGVSNSVSAKTTLTGASPSAQLQVSNTNAAGGAYGLGVSSASGSATAAFTNSASGTGLSASSASGTGVVALSGGAGKPGLSARSTAGGPAAAFTVNAGVAPFTVSSQAKVSGLNADQLDGLDSAALQKRVSGTCAAGTAVRVVNADGSVSCQAVGGALNATCAFGSEIGEIFTDGSYVCYRNHLRPGSTNAGISIGVAAGACIEVEALVPGIAVGDTAVLVPDAATWPTGLIYDVLRADHPGKLPLGICNLRASDVDVTSTVSVWPVKLNP